MRVSQGAIGPSKIIFSWLFVNLTLLALRGVCLICVAFMFFVTEFGGPPIFIKVDLVISAVEQKEEGRS